MKSRFLPVLLVSIVVIAILLFATLNRPTIRAQQDTADFLTLLGDLEGQLKAPPPGFTGFTIFLRDDLADYGRRILFRPNPTVGSPIIDKLAPDYMCIAPFGVLTHTCFKYDLISSVSYQSPLADLPDLSINLFGPSTVTLSQSSSAVTYTVVVTNIGRADANQFDVGFIGPDGTMTDLGTGTLKPGQSAHFQANITFAVSGDFQLTAIADPQNVLQESTKDNNRKTLAVTVVGPK